jgi:hypothetical protein
MRPFPCVSTSTLTVTLSLSLYSTTVLYVSTVKVSSLHVARCKLHVVVVASSPKWCHDVTIRSDHDGSVEKVVRFFLGQRWCYQFEAHCD